jgi:hypothetical protein
LDNYEKPGDGPSSRPLPGKYRHSLVLQRILDARGDFRLLDRSEAIEYLD